MVKNLVGEVELFGRIEIRILTYYIRNMDVSIYIEKTIKDFEDPLVLNLLLVVNVIAPASKIKAEEKDLVLFIQGEDFVLISRVFVTAIIVETKG